MKTLHLEINPEDLCCQASRETIATAAKILRNGSLVAFPTETVYGLGANALDPQAVEKIFVAKQRPAWDPLIVHVSSRAMLSQVVAAEIAAPLSAAANALMNAFWPGPLTLLLLKSEAVPPIVTAGRPLVGVRMPAHPVAKALIAAAGIPIAAPSANLFGRISPTRASHVYEDLEGRVDAILDAGETTHGLESTVVDASGELVVVYRPGIISLRQIREVSPSAIQWQASEANAVAESSPEARPSPGLELRHYAPRAQLLLVEATADQAAKFHRAMTDETYHKLGIMLPRNFLSEAAFGHDRAMTFHWGDWNDLPTLAHRLFAGLRELDTAGVDAILCPLPHSGGLGTAIRDRLFKAAKSV